MRIRVERWGDNLAVRIPEFFAISAGILEGTEVELSAVQGHAIISPMPRPRPTLEELLERVTPGNRHGEVETGPAAGAETW
jgi:antitoxin MazE